MRKLNPDGKSPILCFVGPPGVGKTSLGQSIARATARKFARLSLGGVHDEAEIRGHRRTYIGALPGNIIQSIRKAGTPQSRHDARRDGQARRRASMAIRHRRCSKCSIPSRTRPSATTISPLPFDLSKVMFIGTANVLDTVPGPVRDRMEVIELPGYTEDEKLEIAKRYLLKRQLEATGLKPEQCEITEEAIRTDHPRLHARSRRAQSRAQYRRDLPACRRCASRRASVERMRIDPAGV